MKTLLSTFFFLSIYFDFLGQTNLGFEQTTAGAITSSSGVSGWTIDCGTNVAINGACFNPTYNVWSSPINEFSVMTTPILNDPFIGTVGHSPLGGSKIARLNNTSGLNTITRASTKFNVTTSNNLLYLAYCGSWDGTTHQCCDQPYSRIEIYDCNNNFIGANSTSIIPGGVNCMVSSPITYTVNSMGISWFNWKTSLVDLTPYVGTCITIRVVTGDCALGGHHGSMYFDAAIGSQLIGNGMSLPMVSNPNPVSFCSGGPATIQAPSGYLTYSWTAPSNYAPIPPNQSTLSILTVTNPLAGSVFSVYMNSGSAMYVATYTLAYSNVHVVASGTTAACPMNSNGSASVQAGGSGSGYNYQWFNSTNSVISTSSVISNQPPGVYTVSITAFGSPGCGTATTSVIIPTQTNAAVSYIPKFYCGNTAYLFAGAGNNYQWYNNQLPIGGPVGSAQNLTVSAPTNTDNFSVSYINPLGCRDSLVHTLITYSPQPLSISTNTICLNNTNGTATITLPSNYYPGNNYFHVTNGSGSPAYTASLNLSALSTFTISNLGSSGNYLINAFDGACTYSANFSIPTYNKDFTVSPQTSTICSGSNLVASINFSNSTTTYSYSFTPNIFINSSLTQPVFTVNPQIASGTQSLITYSVSAATTQNCVLTKTVSYLILNPNTPTINTIPALCYNGNFTVTGLPAGGIYSGSGISGTGALNASLLPPGIHIVTYNTVTSGCPKSTSASFSVLAAPILTVSGNTSLCVGQIATLTASGANSYSWWNGLSGATVTMAPTSHTIATVTGTDINGCSVTANFSLAAVPQPTLNASGGSVCAGQTTTITLSGANSYLWNNNNTSASFPLTLSSTQVFTLTGFNSPSCSATMPVTVNITQYPLLSIEAPFTHCIGDEVIISAEGASGYLWNNIPGKSSGSYIATSHSVITVTGINEPGHCVTSQKINLYAFTCTAIEELSAEEIVRIFPNPSSGVFNIEIPTDVFMTVADIAGRTILQNHLLKGYHALDLSEYAAGHYILTIRSEQRTVYKHLYITH